MKEFLEERNVGGCRANYFGTGITVIKTKHRHFNTLVEKVCVQSKRKEKTKISVV